MSSWFRRAPKESSSPEADEPGAAAPVVESRAETLTCQVFGPNGRDEMQIATNGQRITDLLNGMDDEAAAEILLLIPPPQEPDPRRRLHRPGQPVRMVIGPYEVTGQVHVPPGAQASGFLGRVNPRFVAVTQATIRPVGGAPEELTAEVVLANLRRAGTFREIAAADGDRREAASTD